MLKRSAVLNPVCRYRKEHRRCSHIPSFPGRLDLYFTAAAALILLTAGCASGPEYVKPEVPVPPAWREEAPWKEATPADEIPRGAWWEIFGDDALSELEATVHDANMDLAGAAARIAQARAAAGIAEADARPAVSLDPSAERRRTADDLSSGGSGTVSNTIRAPVDMTYELDLFGRVRRSVEASRSELEATGADYQALLLSLQAETASNYFSLRSLDAQIRLLERTLDLRQKSFDLVETLYRNGQVSRLDLARAEAELASARADMAVLARQRASGEHALAVLAGENPSGFTIPSRPLAFDSEVPAIDPGLPSTLLERRPDIAAAERRLAAANALLGVARAAYFPSITLTGSAGYASDELGSLFNWGNRTWAFGPFASLPLFDGGRRKQGVALARARWDEAVTVYRQKVLVGFSEVESALSDLWFLSNQFDALRQAVTSSREAADLTNRRYRAGRVSYLEVVVSERTALASEVLAVRVLGQRLQACVTLIKALGGGWKDADPS